MLLTVEFCYMLGLTLDLGSLKCVTSIVKLQGQKHGKRRRFYLGFPRWQQSDVSAGTKRCSQWRQQRTVWSRNLLNVTNSSILSLCQFSTAASSLHKTVQVRMAVPGFRWKDFFWLSISSVFLPLPSSFQPREDVLSQHHYEEMAAFLGIRKASCFAFISYLVSNGFIQWVAEKGARGQSGQILNFHLTWKMRWERREIVNWLTWPQWQIWLSTKKTPPTKKRTNQAKYTERESERSGCKLR